MRLIMKVVFEFPVVYRDYARSRPQEHTSRGALAPACTIILTYVWHSISPYRNPSFESPSSWRFLWFSRPYMLLLLTATNRPPGAATHPLNLQGFRSLCLMGMIRSGVDS